MNFFIVMFRLRQGFTKDHLAQLLNVSASTVSRIFITWVNFMFFKFGQINMPGSFRGRYKSTRVIMTVLRLNVKQKSHNFGRLVGISPGGAVKFRGLL